MNYTPNYRLPQWVDTDRILMQDFNGAMSNLETALTWIGPLARAADNMGRDLYRRTVQQWVKQGAVGRNDSMWINPLLTREDAGGDGHGWNGRYGVYLGNSGLPTLEDIKPTATELSYISTVPTYPYKNNLAQTEFTTDSSGLLETVGVWAWKNENYTTNKDFSFSITMIRVDTGETVGTAGPFTTRCTPQTYRTTPYTVRFPVDAGRRYRLSMSFPAGHEFYGRAGFAIGNTLGASQDAALSFSARLTENQITKTVTAPAGAAGAVGIVRWAGAGEITLSVNGQPLPQTRTVPGANADGTACQETEFLVDSLPNGEFTLILDMETTADLSVFDYGLIWR